MKYIEIFVKIKKEIMQHILKISKFPCCLTVGYLLQHLKVKKLVWNDSVKLLSKVGHRIPSRVRDFSLHHHSQPCSYYLMCTRGPFHGNKVTKARS